MKYGKIIAAFLAAALLLSFVLTGCSGGGGENAEVTAAAADATETNTEPAETEPELAVPDLPDNDFGGKVFSVLTWSRADTKVQDDFIAEELDGEPLNDAVYQRNSTIKERYNFEIACIEETRANFQNTATKGILSGDDLYAVINGGVSTACTVLARSGYIFDLNSLNYIDLENRWWDQRCNSDLSVGGRRYIGMGDICTMDNSQTWAFIFNRKLAEDFSLGDMYKLVYDGGWTLDAMCGMMQKSAADLNGDGVFDQLDRWGLMTENYNYYMQFLGAGELVAKKDKDDMPYLTLNSPRVSSVLEKVYDIYHGSAGSAFIAEKWMFLASSSVWTEYIIPMFADDRALFYFTGIGNTFKHLRDMESEFGIIPTPKYDEAQEEYYNGISASWATCVVIPVTCQAPDDSAFFLEALCCESLNTVTPAYFDIIFEGKAVRDTESIAMVDLILSTRIFDIGYLNNWGGVTSLFTETVKASSFDFASRYASLESKIQAALEEEYGAQS